MANGSSCWLDRFGEWLTAGSKYRLDTPEKIFFCGCIPVVLAVGVRLGPAK